MNDPDDRHVEGNGLLPHFWHLLWRRAEGAVCGARVDIPDTIVFSNRVPVAWYFTSSKHNGIMRRFAARCTEEELRRVFQRDSKAMKHAKRPNKFAGCPIVAVLEFPGPAAATERELQQHRKSSLGVVSQGDASSMVIRKYLSIRMFESFLDRPGDRPLACVLQRFRDIRGAPRAATLSPCPDLSYNESIRVVWTPAAVYAESCRAAEPLANNSERALAAGDAAACELRNRLLSVSSAGSIRSPSVKDGGGTDRRSLPATCEVSLGEGELARRGATFDSGACSGVKQAKIRSIPLLRRIKRVCGAVVGHAREVSRGAIDICRLVMDLRQARDGRLQVTGCSCMRQRPPLQPACIAPAGAAASPMAETIAERAAAGGLLSAGRGSSRRDARAGAAAEVEAPGRVADVEALLLLQPAPAQDAVKTRSHLGPVCLGAGNAGRLPLSVPLRGGDGCGAGERGAVRRRALTLPQLSPLSAGPGDTVAGAFAVPVEAALLADAAAAGAGGNGGRPQGAEVAPHNALAWLLWQQGWMDAGDAAPPEPGRLCQCPSCGGLARQAVLYAVPACAVIDHYDAVISLLGLTPKLPRRNRTAASRRKRGTVAWPEERARGAGVESAGGLSAGLAPPSAAALEAEESSSSEGDASDDSQRCGWRANSGQTGHGTAGLGPRGSDTKGARSGTVGDTRHPGQLGRLYWPAHSASGVAPTSAARRLCAAVSRGVGLHFAMHGERAAANAPADGSDLFWVQRFIASGSGAMDGSAGGGGDALLASGPATRAAHRGATSEARRTSDAGARAASEARQARTGSDGGDFAPSEGGDFARSGAAARAPAACPGAAGGARGMRPGSAGAAPAQAAATSPPPPLREPFAASVAAASVVGSSPARSRLDNGPSLLRPFRRPDPSDPRTLALLRGIATAEPVLRRRQELQRGPSPSGRWRVRALPPALSAAWPGLSVEEYASSGASQLITSLLELRERHVLADKIAKGRMEHLEDAITKQWVSQLEEWKRLHKELQATGGHSNGGHCTRRGPPPPLPAALQWRGPLPPLDIRSLPVPVCEECFLVYSEIMDRCLRGESTAAILALATHQQDVAALYRSLSGDIDRAGAPSLFQGPATRPQSAATSEAQHERCVSAPPYPLSGDSRSRDAEAAATGGLGTTKALGSRAQGRAAALDAAHTAGTQDALLEGKSRLDSPRARGSGADHLPALGRDGEGLEVQSRQGSRVTSDLQSRDLANSDLHTGGTGSDTGDTGTSSLTQHESVGQLGASALVTADGMFLTPHLATSRQHHSQKPQDGIGNDACTGESSDGDPAEDAAFSDAAFVSPSPLSSSDRPPVCHFTLKHQHDSAPSAPQEAPDATDATASSASVSCCRSSAHPAASSAHGGSTHSQRSRSPSEALEGVLRSFRERVQQHVAGLRRDIGRDSATQQPLSEGEDPKQEAGGQHDNYNVLAVASASDTGLPGEVPAIRDHRRASRTLDSSNSAGTGAGRRVRRARAKSDAIARRPNAASGAEPNQVEPVLLRVELSGPEQSGVVAPRRLHADHRLQLSRAALSPTSDDAASAGLRERAARSDRRHSSLHPDASRSAPRRAALPSEPDRRTTTYRAKGVPAFVYDGPDAATARSRDAGIGAAWSSSAMVRRILAETYGPAAAAKARSVALPRDRGVGAGVSESLREIEQRIRKGPQPLCGPTTLVPRRIGTSPKHWRDGFDSELGETPTDAGSTTRGQPVGHAQTAPKQPIPLPEREGVDPTTNHPLSPAYPPPKGQIRELSAPQLFHMALPDSLAPPIGGYARKPARTPLPASRDEPQASERQLHKDRLPKAFCIRPAGSSKSGLVGGDSKAADVSGRGRGLEAKLPGHPRALDRRLGLPSAQLDGARDVEAARARRTAMGNADVAEGTPHAAEVWALHDWQQGEPSDARGRSWGGSRRASSASAHPPAGESPASSVAGRPSFDARVGHAAQAEAGRIRMRREQQAQTASAHRRAERRRQSHQSEARKRDHAGFAPPITDAAYERLTGHTDMQQLGHSARSRRASSSSRPGSAARGRPSSARASQRGSLLGSQHTKEWLSGLPDRLLRRGASAGGLLVARPSH